jgi:pyruvate dehydrogenase E1 component alpha subunit
LPIAVGLGLADTLRSRPALTACFFGDGAVAEGEFHESLNLAALWKLPVLFLCENNLYAMGTALERSESVLSVASKAAAYDVHAECVDGMDVLAAEAATRAAAARVRESGEPMLLEFQTYRFRGHSMADPELYRDKDEVRRWRERDPIALFDARLRSLRLLDDTARAAVEREAETEIDAAVREAEAGEWEPVEDLLRFVTAERAP